MYIVIDIFNIKIYYIVILLGKVETSEWWFAQAKIFKIAQERYRGWRADLSATHKTYVGDMEALIWNKPEELDIEEWKAMIAYFETDDFKVKLVFFCLIIWFCFNSIWYFILYYYKII